MIALENTPYYTTYRNLLADKQNKNDEVTLIFRRITESSNPASLALVDHLIEENKRLLAEIERLRAIGDDMTTAYLTGYHKGKDQQMKGGAK